MKTLNFNPELEQFVKNAKNFNFIKETNEIDYVYDEMPDENVKNAECHYFYYKNMSRDIPIVLDLIEYNDNSKAFALYYDAAPVMYGQIDCTPEYKPIKHLNTQKFLTKLECTLNKMYENKELY